MVSFIIRMVILVKKAIEIIYRVLLAAIVLLWVGLIIVEFSRYNEEKPMLIVIKEDKIFYDDGDVTVDYGLGYKSITYNRTSIKGREFGHIFTKVRDKLPTK